MKICALLIVLLAASVSAETLNEWLAGQIRMDERLLSDSLSEVNGYSFSSLKGLRTYVPFFLEPPTGFNFASEEQRSSFAAWTKNSTSGFLPGGYILRLRFNGAQTLFATTGGEWSGPEWRSLALEGTITVEPSSVWSGGDGDYLYATLLAGVRSRLLVYDRRGEIKHQEVFNSSAEDIKEQLAVALKQYSDNEVPVLEMISLGEYLENQEASWRAVKLTEQFNLRNQQERPDEQERLKRMSPLTRIAAINRLQRAQQSIPKPPPPSETPEQMKRIPSEVPTDSARPMTRLTQAPVAAVEQRALMWLGLLKSPALSSLLCSR